MPIKTRVKTEYICDVHVKYRKLYLAGQCEWIPENSWHRYVRNEDIVWIFIQLANRFKLGNIHDFPEPSDSGAFFSMSTFDKDKFEKLIKFCKILADLVDSGYHFNGIISGGSLDVSTPVQLQAFEGCEALVH